MNGGDYTLMDELILIAERLGIWLDDQNGHSMQEKTMQLFKILEEYGEVASAWVGWQGQNPRKGVTHELDDVHDELVDVILTAMVSIVRLDGNLPNTLARGVAKYEQRLRGVGA